MDCFQKVLESIVIDKFADKMEDHATKVQHGYIRGRGCHTAIGDYIKHSKTYKLRKSMHHIALIDIEKAYPSVDPEIMCKILIHRIGNYR